MDKQKICLAVGAAFLVAIGIYFYLRRQRREDFTHAGALDTSPSLDSTYQMVSAPEDAVTSENFADMIDDGNLADVAKQPDDLGSARPLERLQRVQGRDLLPRTAASVTPYDVDVANPSTWAFAVNAPRVNLGLDRLARQADPYRGDIPITYHPDVPLISKSHHGRDSQRLDGTFADHFVQLYNRYTNRAYKNLPIKISNGETVMDGN